MFNIVPSFFKLASLNSRVAHDAQRTVGLVRFHAAQYHIDPHKVGLANQIQ